MIHLTEQLFKSCVLGFVLILVGIKNASSQKERNDPNSFSPPGVGQSPSYFFYQQSEYPRDCFEVLGRCSSSNSSGVNVIKPDGYSDPFDVYCDSDGFTTIERRTDNLIRFGRSWDDYESGFGFPTQEVWLGNKRLSYLTNQREYQLRIDITLADGSTFYVTYDSFRISDAYSNYKLVSTGQYKGTTVTCPTNMVSGNCTCQRSCADPESCTSACHVTGSCVCPEGFLMNNGHCIPQSQCGCFIPEAADGQGIVLKEEGVYVSPNCGRRCSCRSAQLDCEDNFQCSSHGSCEENNSKWNCSCNDGYEGDGVECTAIITVLSDCQDVFRSGQNSSGVYDIHPAWSEDPFQVYCNMADGGGWTVFQRQDGSGDFNLDWNDYKAGFGSPDGGMWLGNDKLYQMTNQKNHTLRIDLTDRDGGHYYATYTLFRINDENDKYRLESVGTYAGNTGYDALSWHKGKQFSTRDQDNDGWSSYDCAEQHEGGWWFGYYYYYYNTYYCRNHENYCDYFPVGSYCANCAHSHLNGNHRSSTRGKNIFWTNLSGYDCGLQNTEMKIRPVET